jgi:hypothetical protein
MIGNPIELGGAKSAAEVRKAENARLADRREVMRVEVEQLATDANGPPLGSFTTRKGAVDAIWQAHLGVSA